MSRIATRKIKIPNGVIAEFNEEVFKVKGPKGELTSPKLKDVIVDINNDYITTKARYPKNKFSYAMSGTANSLINNMIIGVTKGYKRELDISGVGYRAILKDNTISLSLGLSYILKMAIPKGLTIEIPKPTRIVIKGYDKLLVTQFAALIRSKRKAEPYKGKGIRYLGEIIIRKEGKKVGK